MKYIIALFFILSACTSLKEKNYSVKENVMYSQASERNVGDFYRPNDPSVRPVVLLVHGGGWVRRDKSDMEGIAEKLVRNGFAIFNINYRLAPKDIYPAQLEDLRQALYFLKANAMKYRIDSDRMAAFGYSAGGHLAALVGVVGDKDETGTNQIPLQAVVAGGTPFDLSVYEESDLVMKFLGGKRSEKLEVYKEASPMFHIDNSDPDFFLYHGKNDWVVEYEQMTNFSKELVKHGVGYESFTVPVMGHMATFAFSEEARERALAFLTEKLKP